MTSAAAVVLSVWAAAAAGQTPQPFPRTGESRPPAPATPAAPRQVVGTQQPQPTAPATGQGAAQVSPPAAPPAQAGSIDPNAPRPDEVVFPVYPAAQFLASFDAGRGQRYFLYGTTAGFAEIIAYYRTQLNDKGDLVFKEPPTHVFEVGRYREESMAFPPGVTVKDWMWGGSQGYPNPKPAGQPARYPTVIMIVPPPASAPAPRR